MKILEHKRFYYNLDAVQSIGTTIDYDEDEHRVNLWINQECHNLIAFDSRTEACYFSHFLDVELSRILFDDTENRIVIGKLVKLALDKTLERTESHG